MKNKLLILSILLMNIIAPAFSFEISNELKLGSMMFIKMFIGVIASSIIIWISLLIYKKVTGNVPVAKNNDSAKKSSKKNTSDKFKCEIDDTETMEEAINTFFKINN